MLLYLPWEQNCIWWNIELIIPWIQQQKDRADVTSDVLTVPMFNARIVKDWMQYLKKKCDGLKHVEIN